MGYEILEKNIREGLKTVIHRARMETLSQEPLIVYDGAHNEPAIENLKSSIDMYYSDFKRRYIISILKRKDYNKMIEMLLEDEEAEFIFTSGNDIERYVSKEELYNVALKYVAKQKLCVKDLEEAIEDVFVDKNNDVVNLVVGSFYTYETTINKINDIKNKDIKWINDERIVFLLY